MNNPLTEKQRKEINLALAELNAAQPHIEALAEMGIEGIEELQLRAEHHRKRLLKLKEVYFAGRP